MGASLTNSFAPKITQNFVHFGSLNKLTVGDEVEFVDAYGKKHLYEVGELITLDRTAVSDMQSGGWDFTMFTCTKSGEQRVTVRCKRK